MIVGGCYSIDADLPSTEVDKRVDWLGAFLVTAGLVTMIGSRPFVGDMVRWLSEPFGDSARSRIVRFEEVMLWLSILEPATLVSSSPRSGAP